jgi:hypothetical protein
MGKAIGTFKTDVRKDTQANVLHHNLSSCTLRAISRLTCASRYFINKTRVWEMNGMTYRLMSGPRSHPLC